MIDKAKVLIAQLRLLDVVTTAQIIAMFPCCLSDTKDTI